MFNNSRRHRAFGFEQPTRPTLYRILSSLEAEGVVIKASGKRNRLGARLIGLANGALPQVDVRSIARLALAALHDETGETVHLAIRNRDEMVYFYKIDSREVVHMSSTIGTRVPLFELCWQSVFGRITHYRSKRNHGPLALNAANTAHNDRSATHERESRSGPRSGFQL